MISTRLNKRASAGVCALAVTLGLGATFVPASAAAPSTTTTSVSVQSATVAYGEITKLTVTVDTTDKGPKPAGKVELKIGASTLVADVANSGKVDFDLPLVDASATPYAATATFTPTDVNAFSASTSTPVNVTVTKDTTTSTVSAVHKKAKRKIVAKDVVVSKFGKVPTGNVKFILKRNGRKLGTATTSLNAAGAAKATFSKVPAKGNFKVIAKFAGSTNFLKSNGSIKFTS